MNTLDKLHQEIAADKGVTLTPPSQEVDSQQAPEEVIPEEEGVGGLLGMAGQSIGGAYDLWQSAGAGIAKAGFETKDFLLGEPAEEDKSDIRKGVEQASKVRRERSGANGLVEGVTQFATGMIGVGKLAAPIKGVQKLKAAGKAGRFAYETARGAAAGAIVIDPHEERLSNLIQEYEVLENPVTEFLAADPDDSAAMGRMKNALEGIGMDLALAGVFAATVKAVKLGRSGAGDEAVLKALSEADEVATSQPVEIGVDPAVKGADTTVTTSVEMNQAKSVAQAIPAQSKAPQWDTRVEVTEVDAEEIIRGFREEAEVISKYGSREEAIKAGYKAPQVKIPWQKIGGSDDLKSLTASTAKVLKGQMDAIKGGDVLSDQRVQNMVRQSSEMFGDDPMSTMGVLARAGDEARNMVANMEASYIISRRLFEDTHQAVLKVRMGMLDEFGGDAAVAQAEIIKRFQAAADMLATGNSMRAAAGRSMRRLRSDFAIKPSDVEAFAKLDPEQLMEAIYKTGGDVKKMKQVANPGWWRRVVDEASFSLTNSLLWFYPTHVVNTSTNLYMLAARPTEKLIGSLAMGKAGGGVRRQAAKEYAYTLNSLGDAWEGMVEAFKRGDSILNPHQTEYFEQGSRINAQQLQWKPVKDIWDLFENGYKAANYRNIVGLPTRSLGAVDEFVKTLRYRAVVQARAAVEGAESGLSGRPLADYVSSRLDEAFSVEGRAIDSAALYDAQVSTFQQELLSGTVGAGVRNFRHNVPETAIILPFVKTPINVLRYAWKMTPGLNMAQKEYRQMLSGAMGEEARAHAIGQMALGSTFMGIAAGLSLHGKITGGGPSDPALARQMRGDGWQPYSFVIDNDDGSKTYVPLGRFDPVGMPFGMVADIVDMQVTHPNTKEAEKGIMAVGVALAKSFSEKTFLLNINQFMRALTEPEQNLSKFLGNTAGNMVPGSSAIRNYVNQDPYLRDARGFVDNMMKGMPGYSATLPPSRDAFGEPLWRKRSLSTNQKMDLVEQEHQRIMLETGDGIRAPSASREGVDLRDVTLSDGRNAYDLFQEYAAKPSKGRSLKESLTKVIEADNYQLLVDGPAAVKGTKLYALSGVVQKYREVAYKRLLKEYPEFRTQIMQRKLQVKSELTANKKAESRGQTGSAEQLLQSLGY